MAVARWPAAPDPRLLPWLISRFRNEPPPAGTPTTVPAYWWGVAKWCGWRRKLARLLPGQTAPPRPVSTDKAPIPDKIPQWAWSLLRALNIAVPLAPLPPPPPPAHPVPPNSWALPFPLMFTSWGPALEWRQDHDFALALQKMIEAGVATVALEIGQYPKHYSKMVRDRGLHCALWTPVAQDRDASWLADSEGVEGYIPQIEGSGEYIAAIAQLSRGVGAGLSRSVVTTNSGFDHFTRRPNGTEEGELTTVEAEELIDAGVTHAMVECYSGDMQPFDVGNKMWENTRRGVHYQNPVIGLAGRPGVNIASYQPDLSAYGRQFGVYLAEPMTPTDWADLRAT